MQGQHAYSRNRKPAQGRHYVFKDAIFRFCQEGFGSLWPASMPTDGDEIASLGQLARWLDKFPNEHLRH